MQMMVMGDPQMAGKNIIFAFWGCNLQGRDLNMQIWVIRDPKWLWGHFEQTKK